MGEGGAERGQRGECRSPGSGGSGCINSNVRPADQRIYTQFTVHACVRSEVHVNVALTRGPLLRAL